MTQDVNSPDINYNPNHRIYLCCGSACEQPCVLTVMWTGTRKVTNCICSVCFNTTKRKSYICLQVTNQMIHEFNIADVCVHVVTIFLSSIIIGGYGGHKGCCSPTQWSQDERYKHRQNRPPLPHKFTNICAQFRISHQVCNVFGLWVETGIPGESP